MEVELDGEVTVLGALVDAVQEVFEMEAEQIAPPPKLGTRLRTSLIKGMGKREGIDQFIIVLDIDKVFSADELVKVQTVNDKVDSSQVEETLV